MQQNIPRALHGSFPCVRSLDFCLLSPTVHDLMGTRNRDAFAFRNLTEGFARCSGGPDTGVPFGVLFPTYFIAFFGGETGRRGRRVLIQPCQ